MLKRVVMFSAVCALVVASVPFTTLAQTAAELKNKIDAHSQQIANLEKEIAKYEQELTGVRKEKQTLQSAISELTISQKKLGANISVTQNRIDSTELQIEQLSRSIGSKENSIEIGAAGLAEAIRRLDAAENQTFAEALLRSGSIADTWEDIDAVNRFQGTVYTRINELAAAKQDLQNTQDATKEKRAELLSYQNQLYSQKHALDISKREKDKLLSATKNKESNYQDLIAEKQAAKAQFESELNDLESQLKYTLDPSQLPPSAAGVLRWPLDSVRITQYFGNTEFARSGAYSGKGHNGVDFAASIGTPLHAVLSGVVEGTGNTDKGGCYSYGKWVLIRHNNGLTTLYAHLSETSVSSGQAVGTGQVIGYTGFTGYATGPHLHFSVFASSAVQIMNLGTWYSQNGKTPTTACAKAGVSIPVAPLSAYLNPMDYLPGR